MLQLVADVLRIYTASVSIVLLATCIYCMFRPILWDQRVRFGALAGIGVALAGGLLEGVGGPLTWRIPILAVATTAAVVGTASFLRRRRGR